MLKVWGKPNLALRVASKMKGPLAAAFVIGIGNLNNLTETEGHCIRVVLTGKASTVETNIAHQRLMRAYIEPCIGNPRIAKIIARSCEKNLGMLITAFGKITGANQEERKAITSYFLGIANATEAKTAKNLIKEQLPPEFFE
jgi:hypothetical protein